MPCCELEGFGIVQAKQSNLQNTVVSQVERINQLIRESIAEHHHDPRHSVQLAQEALESAQRIGDQEAIMGALNASGTAHFLSADYDVAISDLTRALELARGISNQRLKASCLNSLGNCYHRLGELELALAYYQDFMSIVQDLHDARGQAVALTNLGLIYNELQDQDSALRCQREAYEKMLTCGEFYVTAKLNEGVVLNSLGRFEEAIEVYQVALGLARAQENRLDEMRLLCNTAESYSQLGQMERAFEHLEFVLSLARRIDAPHQEAHALLTFGAAWRKAGDLVLAQEYFAQAVSLTEKIGQKRFMIEAHRALSEVLEERQLHAAALLHHKQFSTLESALYRSTSEQRGRALLARLEVEKARFDAEVHRLTNVELARINVELEQANTALRNTLQALGFEGVKGATFAKDWDQNCPLSARELQVLQLMASGQNNRAIGLILGISNATSRFHVSSILSKLGVTNRTQAVAIGLQQGWLGPVSRN